MKDITKSHTVLKTKSEYDLAIAVSDKVELTDVRLISCDCQQRPMDRDRILVFDIAQEVEVKSHSDSEESYVIASVTFHFKAFGEDADNEDECVKMDATFMLLYKATTLEGLQEENFRQFGELNAIYNAWPYWREFIQAMVGRMELPSLTIPVFRLSRPTKTPSQEKQAINNASGVVEEEPKPNSDKPQLPES